MCPGAKGFFPTSLWKMFEPHGVTMFFGGLWNEANHLAIPLEWFPTSQALSSYYNMIIAAFVTRKRALQGVQAGIHGLPRPMLRSVRSRSRGAGSTSTD